MVFFCKFFPKIVYRMYLSVLFMKSKWELQVCVKFTQLHFSRQFKTLESENLYKFMRVFLTHHYFKWIHSGLHLGEEKRKRNSMNHVNENQNYTLNQVIQIELLDFLKIKSYFILTLGQRSWCALKDILVQKKYKRILLDKMVNYQNDWKIKLGNEITRYKYSCMFCHLVLALWTEMQHCYAVFNWHGYGTRQQMEMFKFQCTGRS